MKKEQTFIWPLRIYYEDTDAGGVVYHARYLNFMERARTEWLRALGIEQDQLRRQMQRIFAVRKMAVEYRKPAFFNELLEITTHVSKSGRASIDLEQSLRRKDGEILTLATVNIACLDSETLRPKALPDNLRQLLCVN
jgi:acyl-CoA thioester hydrolase